MRRYLIHRLVQLPITLLLVCVIAFTVIRLLPGDPAMAWLGESFAGDEESYRAARAELGLDQPWPVQFAHWLAHIAQGDMGISARIHLPVGQVILQRIPITLELTLLGMLIAAIIGVPAAVISAVRPNSMWDRVATVGAIAGMAIPDFWLGLLLIYLLGVALKWLPPSGFTSLTGDPGGNLKLMIMPAVTIGLGRAATVMRQTRGALLDVLGSAYVRTARAKGLMEVAVIWRHAFPNALLPVVTVIGLQIGRLVGAAVMVETIFAIPGLGRWAINSILFRDYSALQGVIMVFALWVLLINLLTDLLYAYLDPRIRLE